jgi:hypothetical protein
LQCLSDRYVLYKSQETTNRIQWTNSENFFDSNFNFCDILWHFLSFGSWSVTTFVESSGKILERWKKASVHGMHGLTRGVTSFVKCHKMHFRGNLHGLNDTPLWVSRIPE